MVFELVRIERLKRRLTQKEFAAMVGVSIATYKRFEMGCKVSKKSYEKIIKGVNYENYE